MKDDEFKALYENYKKSKFKQQKLNGWRPLPTISCITIIFVCFGVFFIIMGLIDVIVISQLKITTLDNYPLNCKLNETKKEYFYEKKMKTNMKSPIMVYYQIDDFQQNNKEYMDNIKNEDIFDDNFTFWEVNKRKINGKVSFPQDYSDNWEKINPYSHIRKFWGTINEDLEKDNNLVVKCKIGKNFKNNAKHLILIEKSIFGGPKSYILGLMCIAFGLLCLITSLIFINAYNKFHKKI